MQLAALVTQSADHDTARLGSRERVLRGG
jgi:hypothetical protein